MYVLLAVYPDNSYLTPGSVMHVLRSAEQIGEKGALTRGAVGPCLIRFFFQICWHEIPETRFRFNFVAEKAGERVASDSPAFKIQHVLENKTNTSSQGPMT